MEKILMIGQAPGKRGGEPCMGFFFTRIWEPAGLTEDEYRKIFDRRNLLSRWPGKNGKGDAFPMPAARRAAKRIEVDGRTIVLAGRNVAAAFGICVPFLVEYWERGAIWHVFPHPSGVNLWWNDPENKRMAERHAREILRNHLIRKICSSKTCPSKT